MHAAWVESVRRVAHRRRRHRTLLHALGTWAEHASMQALLARASSLMGSEYGGRQRSSKTAMRALFSIWAVRTREAAEEAAEAEARAKAAAHALQLADLERARSKVLAELDETRKAKLASDERAADLEAQLALAKQEAKAELARSREK